MAQKLEGLISPLLPKKRERERKKFSTDARVSGNSHSILVMGNESVEKTDELRLYV